MTVPNLTEELKRHFVEAGFIDSGLLMAEICPVPDDTLVMHNSYALMVGCEVSSEGSKLMDSSLLLRAKEKMHDYILNALLALENKKGLVVDGYLLIILNDTPEGESIKMVREIELDTKVCRKHIVWPLINGNGLDRLQFVTILSLPEPLQGNDTNTTSFELSAEANALLSKYKELGNLDRLMSAIKSGELGDADR